MNYFPSSFICSQYEQFAIRCFGKLSPRYKKPANLISSSLIKFQNKMWNWYQKLEFYSFWYVCSWKVVTNITVVLFKLKCIFSVNKCICFNRNLCWSSELIMTVNRIEKESVLCDDVYVWSTNYKVQSVP